MHIIKHRMVGFRFFINLDMDVYWHSKKTAKINNLGFYKKFCQLEVHGIFCYVQRIDV